jgi:hypothetical protein
MPPGQVSPKRLLKGAGERNRGRRERALVDRLACHPKAFPKVRPSPRVTKPIHVEPFLQLLARAPRLEKPHEAGGLVVAGRGPRSAKPSIERRSEEPHREIREEIRRSKARVIPEKDSRCVQTRIEKRCSRERASLRGRRATPQLKDAKMQLGICREGSKHEPQPMCTHKSRFPREREGQRCRSQGDSRGKAEGIKGASEACRAYRSR